MICFLFTTITSSHVIDAYFSQPITTHQLLWMHESRLLTQECMQFSMLEMVTFYSNLYQTCEEKQLEGPAPPLNPNPQSEVHRPPLSVLRMTPSNIFWSRAK